jgi:hypothetical protein
MSNYVVSRTALQGGYHEVHNLMMACPRRPLPADRQELGEHPSGRAALEHAKLEFPRSNGCRFCCRNAYDSTLSPGPSSVPARPSRH